MSVDPGGDPTPEVDAALRDEEFYLLYQPEIDLHTGGFVGVEALLRWQRDGRTVNPADFLERLESSGDIIAVGHWALETACSQATEWYSKGYRFRVAVNVSIRQLAHPDFVDHVRHALRASRLAPAQLTLELSYRWLDTPDADRVLQELDDLHVTLALDDAAPGRPDVATVVDTPIRVVKLDRALVSSTLEGDEVSRYIHEARSHALVVVASGIEDAVVRDRLRAEEVDVGQGFHFARPYEAREIDRFLEDYALFSGRPL